MKKTAMLEEVIQSVHDVSKNHYDETVRVKEMEFENADWMRIGDNRFQLLPSAQRLFANRLRVPHSYLMRCPDELQRDNLQYWLDREAQNRETLFCRFDGYALRAVFTKRYTALDHMEVLTKMLEYGFDPSTEIQFAFDAEMMVLKVPEYDRFFHLSEKDKIVPGISIANSEVGVLALSIEAFYYRVLCTNGLITKTATDARYKHISRKVMDAFPMILEGVISQSHRGSDRFRISTQSPVDNPQRSIEVFAKQFLIPQEQTQIIQQAFYLEPGATMFHIIQAFTRAAQVSGLTATDAYRLERAGGNILSMVKV